MSKMTADEIMNEVRKQHLELKSTRYKPDATLFISEDCWATLLDELPYEVVNTSAGSGSERFLMGYTTVVVNGLKQCIELKENARYGEGWWPIIDYYSEGEYQGEMNTLEHELLAGDVE